MSTFTQVRSGLATRLNTGIGIAAPAQIPSTPTPPCALVIPALNEFQQQFDPTGPRWHNFTIKVLAGKVGDSGSQLLLDSYLDTTGSKSVYAALMADRTLGGVAIDLRVPSFQGYGAFVYSELTLLGVEFSVQVFA